MDIPPATIKKVYQIFFERIGEICTACNQLIFYSVYKFAHDKQIPYILLGSSAKSEGVPIYQGVRYCREELFKNILKNNIYQLDADQFSIKKLNKNFTFIPINVPDYINWDYNQIIQELLDNKIVLPNESSGYKHKDCSFAEYSNYKKFHQTGFAKNIFHQAYLLRTKQTVDNQADSPTQPPYPAPAAKNIKSILNANLDDGLNKNRWQYVTGKKDIKSLLQAYQHQILSKMDIKSKVDTLISIINQEIQPDRRTNQLPFS